MTRRRLFEPCGADGAGDERGASSTSPAAPAAAWEAAPHAGNVNINVPSGGADMWVVHRGMQIYEALPGEGKGYIVFHVG
jgi:hypothetical protein